MDTAELPCSLVLQKCTESLRAQLSTSMEPAEVEAEVAARLEATGVCGAGVLPRRQGAMYQLSKDDLLPDDMLTVAQVFTMTPAHFKEYAELPRKLGEGHEADSDEFERAHLVLVAIVDAHLTTFGEVDKSKMTIQQRMLLELKDQIARVLSGDDEGEDADGECEGEDDPEDDVNGGLGGAVDNDEDIELPENVYDPSWDIPAQGKRRAEREGEARGLERKGESKRRKS
jgi:hypothetical protein